MPQNNMTLQRLSCKTQEEEDEEGRRNAGKTTCRLSNIIWGGGTKSLESWREIVNSSVVPLHPPTNHHCKKTSWEFLCTKTALSYTTHEER